MNLCECLVALDVDNKGAVVQANGLPRITADDGSGL